MWRDRKDSDVLQVHLQPNGAVIAAGDLGVDCDFTDSILYPVGDYNLIDAPSYIPGPGLSHVGPPGIRALAVRIDVPEGINKSLTQQF